MNLDEMLTQSTAELELAETDLRAAQERVAELRTIQEGIRLALQRYGQAAPTATAGVHVQAAPAKMGASDTRRPRRRAPKRSQPQVSQSELCLQILVESGRPTSSTDVRDRLEEMGHSFDGEQVRAALTYLLRKERVVRVEPGVWSLPPGHEDRPEAHSGPYRPPSPIRQTG